jgi:hypothetical protein
VIIRSELSLGGARAEEHDLRGVVFVLAPETGPPPACLALSGRIAILAAEHPDLTVRRTLMVG